MFLCKPEPGLSGCERQQECTSFDPCGKVLNSFLSDSVEDKVIALGYYIGECVTINC